MSDNIPTKLKEQATLYVLDALDARETFQFEKSLASSPELSAFTQELQSTLQLTEDACNLVPEGSYLIGQRNLLRGRIEQLILEQQKSPAKAFWSRAREWFITVFVDSRQPAWAVATYMLAAFFIGRWVVLDQTTVQDTYFTEDRLQEVIRQGQLENTKLHLTGSKTSPVEFAFQTNEDLKYKGGLEDQNVKQLLYYLLLNDENTGNRLKAIELVEELEPAEETELVLISTMLSDNNTGVRLKSARLLQTYEPTDLILDACQKVLLEEENEAIRQEAMAILSRRPTPEMIPTLKVVGLMDENVFIRNQAKAIVESLNDSTESDEIEVLQ